MAQPVDLQALAQRLNRLEAIQAIKDLKLRYLSACDKKQPDVMRDCFADGEVWLDYGPVGCFKHRDELIDLYTKAACNDHVLDLHLGGNPQIELVDENFARGSWGLLFFQLDTSAKRVMQMGGYYADEYRRFDGEWKITRCVFSPHATELMGMEEGLHRIQFAGKSLAELKWD